jgi:hypothetical protein
MFYTFEIFKPALMGDIKQWASGHCRYRRRYCRGRSVRKGIGMMQKTNVGQCRKKLGTLIRRKGLPCVHH